MPVRRIACAATAAAVALPLSGCFGPGLLRDESARVGPPSGARIAVSLSRTFRLTFTARQTSSGVSRLQPPGRTISGSVYKGTFRTTQLGRPVRAAGTSPPALFVGRGTWVAQINAREDHTRGVATEFGLALATFADRRTGSVCFRFTLVTRDHGLSHTGSFSTIGGTANAGRVTARGTVTNRPDAAPNPAGGNGRGSGRGTYAALARPRGLTAACRALRRL
jgi:hypothetical protein